MEIGLGGTKEKKRRFFRKTGSGGSSSSSSRGGGNSWESLQSPTTAPQSGVSSLTNSFENATISNIPATPPASQQQQLNNLNFPGSSTPPRTASAQSASQHQQNRAKLHGVIHNSPGNSISLDEAEHILMQHRRFMAAPRRARSAERFDGMRIHNSPGEKLVQYPLLTREELLERGSPNSNNKFNSPRPMRTTPCHGTNGHGVSGVNTGMVGDLRRSNQLPLSAAGIVSPPPPYQAAVNEKSGPPTYHQALALAAQKQAAKAAAAGTAPGLPRPLTLNHRTHNRHHRSSGQSQSLDSEFGFSGTTMRSAVSVPAFSNDVICSCSKCQIQNKSMMAGEDYNDSAVYMESQAFLMHEIMTDGMAFCSIM